MAQLMIVHIQYDTENVLNATQNSHRCFRDPGEGVFPQISQASGALRLQGRRHLNMAACVDISLTAVNA